MPGVSGENNMAELKVGDLLEGNPLMGGMSDEAICMEVVDVSDEVVTVRVTYFGIFLTQALLDIKDIA